MKRVIIICEGQTEEEFCKKLLVPFFFDKGISIDTPLIKHSHGGIVSWGRLKKEIRNYLSFDKTAYVTTFIDYYGIKVEHEFPQWEEAKRISDKYECMRILENAMKNDIEESYRYRFLPYIQLHEFEGLLFSNIEIIKAQIPKEELIGLKELEQISDTYENPELINDGKETSPSHRLDRIIRGYNKVVYGSILAELITLKRIREKCPGFNKWINTILSI